MISFKDADNEGDAWAKGQFSWDCIPLGVASMVDELGSYASMSKN